MSTPVGRATNSFYSRARASQVASRGLGARRRDVRGTPFRGRAPGPVEGAQRRFGTYEPGMVLDEQQIHLSGDESDLENSDASGSPDLTPSGSSGSFSAVPQPMLPPHPQPSDYSQVISLLQQQQVALQQVLTGQKSLEKIQDHFEEEIHRLRSNLDEIRDSTCSSADSGSDRTRKRVVTRELSKKVSVIHEAREEHFKPEESSTSDHNRMVQEAIISEIVNQPNSKIKVETARAAVKRCYENQRRIYLEQQEDHVDFCENQSQRRKYRSRRDRKFSRRSAVVTNQERQKYWQFLSLYYVTEESDDPDNPNGIVEHHLPWRSEKLDEFMEILDRRLSQTQQHQPVGLVAKKVRRVGEPSSQPPPPGAPAWAVKKDVQEMAQSTNKENDTPNI